MRYPPLTSETFIDKSKRKFGNKFDYSIINYTSIHNKIKLICPDHGIIEIGASNHLVSKTGCAECGKAQRQDLKNHLKNIKDVHVLSDIFKELNINYLFKEKILSPLLPPVDYFLPEYNLAIQIHFTNDLIQHPKYCIEYLRAKGNVKLIQIFEDELLNKIEIVKSRIKSQLGHSSKIYARKCTVELIDKKGKSSFLNQNHIQGNDKSQIWIGLRHENDLVAVMTFCKPRLVMGKKVNDDEWELSRYCSSIGTNVIGGAGKLLKYFELHFSPNKIYSYADRRWSSGDLYSLLGFNLIRFTSLNYKYYKNGMQFHRFKYRKSMLPDMLDNFDPGLSEAKNMANHGFHQIWDCGNILFEKCIV